MAGTENRLAVERMRYNQAVQAYNQQVQAFPTSLLAKAWGFHQQSFFQATKWNPDSIEGLVTGIKNLDRIDRYSCRAVVE